MPMNRRTIAIAALALCLGAFGLTSSAEAQQAYGYQYGRTYSTQDWERFYHYPYVYYPSNFYGSDYYRSEQDLYHRYPQEMRTPVYNKKWHNEFPQRRKYHSGHHFILDQF